MANRAGKQIAITCISPMKPWRTLCLRVVVFLRDLGLIKESSQRLKRLSFIHFACWAIVKRNKFPYMGSPQRPEKLKYDYLFFCSNFNGTWDEYIDAFSYILPGGMDNIWRWSEQYPKSVPVTPFKRYIQHNQLDTDYYYTAYPGATTNDVKRALQLSAALEKFHAESKELPAEAFAERYGRFLTTIAGNLATTGSLGQDEDADAVRSYAHVV